MRISPVSFNRQYEITPNKINNKSVNFEQPQIKTTPINTAQYLSFCGGKSLSLEETKTQLDKFSSYPPDIKEMIEDELQNGNAQNKTLIDIHREKYSKLNDCATLKEAKEKYGEFEDVLSDTEIDYPDNSFIDEVKKGNVKGFDPDKDVALQLLQLYWGEGFSLTTLKNDYAGQNIHGVFAKLNIPRVDRVYGQYLKLSDKDYNERYTKTISERMRSLECKRVSKEGGESIPRGPLTKEHRANISKGLKEYYKNHPEKLAEMSERELEYYREHPEEKEKMSQIMLRAWNYREANSIKKRMSKFMKRPDISNEELSNVFENSETRKNLKAFWKQNPWAKEIFSKCMEKSWAKQDELSAMGLIYEPIYSCSGIPTEIKREIKNSLDVEIPNFEKLLDVVIIDPRDIKLPDGEIVLHTPEIDMAAEYASNYLRSHDETSHTLADTFNLGLLDAMNQIGKRALKTNGASCPDFKNIFKIWQDNVDKYMSEKGTISANGIKNIYGVLMLYCVGKKDFKSAKQIDDSIEKSYRTVKGSSPTELRRIQQSIYQDLLKTKEALL